MPHSTHGTVLLMGSGEMAPSMVETHKYAIALAGSPTRAVFIDTPAGFQLNADLLAEKAVEFFNERLNLPLEVVSFKSAEQADTQARRAAATALVQATYIFAGPGSPTYAVNQWRGTPLPDAMLESLAHGGCVTFASAAALTLGRLTIPVYEIYKVGEAVRWTEGLNLLGHVGMDVAVVPHWNNTSGGDHDTRFCFMGEPRWEKLYTMLPPSTVVLGIDEHTACLLRLDQHRAEVRGLGEVTVLRGSEKQVYRAGDSFSLDALQPLPGGDEPSGDHPPRPFEPDWESIRSRHDALMAQPHPSISEVSAYLYDLMGLMAAARDRSDTETLYQAEEALRGALVNMVANLGTSPGRAEEMIGPYIDLLIELRMSFRSARQWDQADLIRQRLTGLGIVLEDGPQGTTWRQST